MQFSKFSFLAFSYYLKYIFCHYLMGEAYQENNKENINIFKYFCLYLIVLNYFFQISKNMGFIKKIYKNKKIILGRYYENSA